MVDERPGGAKRSTVSKTDAAGLADFALGRRIARSAVGLALSGLVAYVLIAGVIVGVLVVTVGGWRAAVCQIALMASILSCSWVVDALFGRPWLASSWTDPSRLVGVVALLLAFLVIAPWAMSRIEAGAGTADVGLLAVGCVLAGAMVSAVLPPILGSIAHRRGQR